MSPFATYLGAIRKELAAGDATEHTHRPALKALLESVGRGITATNEPKRIACGSPDFQISRKGVPLGHIETKDIGANLDEMERGKGPDGQQFIRYRDGLPNWILTDYLRFDWFVGGEKRLSVRIAEERSDGKIRPLPDGEESLVQLLTAFFEQPALTVGTARELTRRMAGMTRIIRDLIVGISVVCDMDVPLPRLERGRCGKVFRQPLVGLVGNLPRSSGATNPKTPDNSANGSCV